MKFIVLSCFPEVATIQGKTGARPPSGASSGTVASAAAAVAAPASAVQPSVVHRGDKRREKGHAGDDVGSRDRSKSP